MKNQRKMFLFLKMILFIGFLFLLYFQLKGIHWSQTPEIKNHWYLLLAFFLVPLNWLLEYKKWDETLHFSSIQLGLKAKTQAFFAGIVTGMLTPNMLGNFIGRLYYVPWKKRMDIVLLTMFTNYGQFFASIVFGILAIVLLQPHFLYLDDTAILIGAVFIGLFLLWLFFNWALVLYWVLSKPSIFALSERLSEKKIFSWRILFWSLLRHGVFTVQFLLVLISFGLDFKLNHILLIWEIYLLVTLVPSPFLGKIGIRDSIAVWVFGFSGVDSYLVLVSSLFIWLINLLVPTLFGLLICKRKN